jgi:hypothetical protein
MTMTGEDVGKLIREQCWRFTSERAVTRPAPDPLPSPSPSPPLPPAPPRPSAQQNPKRK